MSTRSRPGCISDHMSGTSRNTDHHSKVISSLSRDAKDVGYFRIPRLPGAQRNTGKMVSNISRTTEYASRHIDFFPLELFLYLMESNYDINDFETSFNTLVLIKNAKWDKQDGYLVNRDCYNSYLYLVEDDNTNHVDKFLLHGKELNQYLDGGSALHLNLEENLTYQNALNLLNIAAQAGCNYFCVNVKITICNQCDTIDKRTLYVCPKCGSENIDHGTRVIGYLKRVSAFSKGRREEHSLRHYHKHSVTVKP